MIPTKNMKRHGFLQIFNLGSYNSLQYVSGNVVLGTIPSLYQCCCLHLMISQKYILSRSRDYIVYFSSIECNALIRTENNSFVFAAAGAGGQFHALLPNNPGRKFLFSFQNSIALYSVLSKLLTLVNF